VETSLSSDGVIRLPRRGISAAAQAPSRLPMGARAMVAVVAAAVTAAAVANPPRIDGGEWSILLLLTVLGMASERFDINLYEDSRLSLSALFLVTVAIVLGTDGIMLAGPAVALAAHVGRGRPFYKLIFNAGVFLMAGFASADVYHGFVHVTSTGRVEQASGAVLAAAANFGVSSALVTAIVVLSGGGSGVLRIWSEKFGWLLPHFVLMGFLAFVLSLAYDAFGIFGVLGFVAPALMERFTMKQFVDRTGRTVRELHEKNARISDLRHELEDAYGETLDAFVQALDLRDTETNGHSTRVAEMSLRMGEALGIRHGTREWHELRHGAMLHDVGKIGVPDSILRKKGPLDEQEWEIIRQHPDHGFNMLRNVRFLAGPAELVRCHHERFDGRGYPRGLKGEGIPLAARIFAVADTFDAITSPRPYKAARSGAEACREIAANSGTQFDPRVVTVLLRMYGGLAEAA
jgi:hypothetical protein